MGMGHVSAGEIRQERQGDDVPGREHRGARAVHPDLTSPQVGRLGEALAARFLTERGAVIESRNLRVSSGELDLVVRLDDTRIAVEVKTVTAPFDPLDAFDARKRDQVKNVATAEACDRVDLIAVTVSENTVEVRWLPAVD